MTQKVEKNELNKKAEKVAKTEETAKPKLKQPKGWKRTHEIKAKELGVEKIEAEWTKENVKAVITRDLNTSKESKRKYIFKLLKIEKGKQVWGKTTFTNVRDALFEIYKTFMS